MMKNKLFICVGGCAVALLSGALASGQVTVDVQSGNIRSRGAVIPQSGPVNGESQTAIDQALAPPGMEGAVNPKQASQTLLERHESSLNYQRAQSAKADARGGAPSGATGENWRYARANGHWWYWTPNNRWVFYYRNQWVGYDPKTYGRYYSNVADASATASAFPTVPRSTAGYRGGVAPAEAAGRVENGIGVRTNSDLDSGFRNNRLVSHLGVVAVPGRPNPPSGFRDGSVGPREPLDDPAGPEAAGLGESAAGAESRSVTSGATDGAGR